MRGEGRGVRGEGLGGPKGGQGAGTGCEVRGAEPDKVERVGGLRCQVFAMDFLAVLETHAKYQKR